MALWKQRQNTWVLKTHLELTMAIKSSRVSSEASQAIGILKQNEANFYLREMTL